MKTNYYLAGIIILILALIGYHYYAAGEAGRQIDEALQEQAARSDGEFSVSYSAIDVFPFSGDIRFRDFNLTQTNYTQRASSIYFDLTYLDFLTIYVRGTEYGLKNLDRLRTNIIKPSIVLRPSMRELKSDTFRIDYKGSAYDLLRHSVTEQAVESPHEFEASAVSFRFTQSNSTSDGFRADSIFIQTSVPPATTSILNDADHFMARAFDITWIPSSAIGDKYGFFIRGFGYETDNIPVDSLLLMINIDDAGSRFMNLDLHSELFHAQAIAEIKMNSQEFSRITFEDGIVNLLATSPRFDNFLQNAEQLFGISIPRKTESVFRFYGPLSNLQVTAGDN